MGIFDGILSVAGPVLGSVFGSPLLGSALGAVGGSLAKSSAAGEARDAAREQNEFSLASSERQMDFQREMAGRQEAFQTSSVDKQMQFQELMSGSAYRRAVADMELAGLNPMLAYHQGGATTPMGSSASGSSQGSTSPAQLVSPKMASLNNAATLAKVSAEIEQIRASTRVADSQALVNAAQIPKIQQETRTGVSSAAHLDAQAKDILERLRVIMPEEHAKLVSEYFLNNARSNLSMAELRTELERTKLTAAEVELAMNEIPRSRNVAGQQDTFWMRNISPYLSDSVRGVTSGLGLKRIIGR